MALALLSAVAAGAKTDDLERLKREIEAFKTTGKYDKAIETARLRASALERRWGKNSAQVATALQEWSDLLAGADRHNDAIPILRRALRAREAVLGPKHPDTAYTLNQLGWSLEATNAYSEAESYLRRALAIRETLLGTDHPHTAFSIFHLGENLFWQAKYAEAEKMLRYASELRVRILGEMNVDTANSLHLLGDTLVNLRRYGDAEITYRRVLAIREHVLGPENPDTALALYDLGSAYLQHDKAAEGLPFLERAAAIREKTLGPKHLLTALSFHQIAQTSFVMGRFTAAKAAAERALAIRQEVLPADDLVLAISLNARAVIHQAEGEFGQAEELVQRALAIQLKKLSADNPDIAISYELLGYLNEFQAHYLNALNFFKRGLELVERRFGRENVTALRLLEGLGRVEDYLGRYAQSEASYRIVVLVREKMFGGDDPGITGALIGIADGYARQGRVQEAIPLYRRALDLQERTYGKDHYLVAIALARLGRQLERLNQYAEAETMFRRSLTISEKTYGRTHFLTAVVMQDLADALDAQGRTAEAETFYRRALEIEERSLGANHPSLAFPIAALAGVSWKLGRPDEAEALRVRELAIRRDAFGEGHDQTAMSYGNLAWIQLGRGKWAESVANYAAASDIYVRRSLSNIAVVTESGKRTGEGEIGRNSWIFLNHISASYLARSSQPGLSESDNRGYAERTFELAQWAGLSDTSSALAQMSVRSVASDPALGILVREHQDLTGEWRTIDAQRSQFLASATGPKPGLKAEVVNQRLAQIESRLAEIGRELQQRFPAYAELSSPRAVPVKELQALLTPDETLVQYSLTPYDCFVWVVTQGDVRWIRLAADERKLAESIATLRKQITNAERFDLELAYTLYGELFAPIAEQIRGKHLLVVPTGALTSLPLHLLVTERPAKSEGDVESYRKAAWLAKTQDITVLPSVSALKALRQQAKPSEARGPFLGFGNPLLLGPTNDDRRAWTVTDCASPGLSMADRDAGASLIVTSLGPPGNLSSFFRGAVADTAAVRQLPPLPETAVELCEVAAKLGSGKDSVFLGAKATETAVKQLSREGRLADARVIHFATHGLVAGEVQALAEPALVLTPPPDGADAKNLTEDDGLLTASEIAQLRLDADWVVLSACNTASGGALGAEALSGLARAFFYAGARALLVSHWEVESDSAVKLIVDAFDSIRRDPKIGRAEALRRAMLAMIENGEPYQAHPNYWAPFVVVGEGAAQVRK
jgi:CHAT domain-containing protein/tetratricopeptide (TPR) repeat protein